MSDFAEQSQPRTSRKTLAQFSRVLMMFISGYMVYRSLAVVSNSASPAVVVLSGSMEPAFQRGDISFSWNTQEKVSVGEVVVYDSPRNVIPIVHRVVNDHHNDQKQSSLTKGDNNASNDLDLYGHGKQYLDRDTDISSGVVKAYVPKIGYVTILMAESPKFKAAFSGGASSSHMLSD